MNVVFKNVLAVISGLIVGSLVNMGIIMISAYVIPPPEGVDITSTESLKAALPLFQPKHFIMPFLAHALGTFSGALLTAFVAANNKIRLAFVIGIFFLIGGIANIIMLSSPIWFSIIDLSMAYIPMAYIAGRLVAKRGNV